MKSFWSLVLLLISMPSFADSESAKPDTSGILDNRLGVSLHSAEWVSPSNFLGIHYVSVNDGNGGRMYSHTLFSPHFNVMVLRENTLTGVGAGYAVSEYVSLEFGLFENTFISPVLGTALPKKQLGAQVVWRFK